MEIVESFLADDDAVILADVGAPTSVDSFLFDDVDLVRNLKNRILSGISNALISG